MSVWMDGRRERLIAVRATGPIESCEVTEVFTAPSVDRDGWLSVPGEQARTVWSFQSEVTVPFTAGHATLMPQNIAWRKTNIASCNVFFEIIPGRGLTSGQE